ncbi:hypothetical protein ACEPPN_007672 [Leptodophora sp. 'Broadleaf-Isolate-01']
MSSDVVFSLEYLSLASPPVGGEDLGDGEGRKHGDDDDDDDDDAICLAVLTAYGPSIRKRKTRK